MAHNLKIAVGTANAALDAALGGLADSGVLRIYDGTQPADAATGITDQNLLAELTLNADSFDPADGASVAANAIATVAALADGLATWFRLFKADGTTVILDGSVGESNADLVLNGVNLVDGGDVTITSLVFSMPLG